MVQTTEVGEGLKDKGQKAKGKGKGQKHNFGHYLAFYILKNCSLLFAP